MSADAPTPAAVPSDAELEQLLVEREEAERREAEDAARALAPGACPVCGAPLEEAPLPGPLRPFSRRPGLSCQACGLRTSPAPTVLGHLLAVLLAVLLAGGGMSAIFSAQRITEPGQQKLVFLLGALLFGGGLFVGYGVHGAAGHKPIAQRILHRRRLRASAEEEEEEEEEGWFRENLEAVVVAIILALIIRHFVMEAFVIPTGSMAPTLLGDHFQLSCPNCGYAYPVSKTEHQFDYGVPTDVTAFCPLCDEKFRREVVPGDVHGGHKILVNKFLYDLRPPRRYEVIVFKFPESPWRNYIKRLVGLPGESIQVRNGDIYADGKLARKPDDVQDSIWIPLHDAAFRRVDGPPAWRPVAEGTEPPQVWTYDADGAEIGCRPDLVAGAPPTWLAFQRDLVDAYGYNQHGGSFSRKVADLRVRARVSGEAGAVVRLGIVESSREGADEYERLVAGRFTFGAGSTTFAVEADGKPEQTVELPALSPGRDYELAFCYADDRARLQVDGRTVLAWDDPFAPSRTSTANVRLSAAGAAASFHRLRIDRDVFYVGSTGSRYDPTAGPVEVPRDSYFVMGDNSPNSEDGRKWGFVHEGHLIGRAFLVFWPLLPFEVKFIR